MARKPIDHAVKVVAVRRVQVGGEEVTAVATDLGFTRRQYYRWIEDEQVMRDAGVVKVAPAPAPAVEASKSQILDDVGLKKLIEAVRDGLDPARAMRQIGRKTSTWALWVERADKGDDECRRIVDAVGRADSDLERDCVRAVKKGGMGWQGPAKLLGWRFPTVYGDDVAGEAAAKKDFAVEDLLAVVRAAGLIPGGPADQASDARR